MIKLIKIVALILTFFTLNVYAQKEANTWYFGKYCGVDFSKNPPEALINGKLTTEEGCVTISDINGNILFYTDGVSVWNSNHEIMKGGTSLYGNSSSTQSGVVIKKPKSKNNYYLFTVDASGEKNGLCYSEIDISKLNGLGSIDSISKNTKLTTPVTEKLTAVTHRNNQDVWVIAHEWESKKFLAYKVTPLGINPEPVISEVGFFHSGSKVNTQGYMKSNPDGSNLALAIEDSNKVEIFDFDNATGKVSNPLLLDFPKNSYVYGVEFSPNGSILYVSAAGTGIVYQYNLQAGNNENIIKSQLQVGNSDKKEWIGSLQIATDGKIYFPIYGTSYLGSIQNPNSLGLACGYQNNTIELAGKINTLGLPNFSQNFFKQDQTVKNIKYFNEKVLEVGKKLILKNIEFDFSKAVIKPISFIELNKVVNVLKLNKKYSIDLHGHTDNIGNKNDNIILSGKRANAIKDYLISKGISKNRITYKSFGSSTPIANNDTEEGRAKNRRVEFVLNLL